jgi:hypothetical protein
VVAGRFARAYRVHDMADREQRLKWHHRFVVFSKISAKHQDALGCHVFLLTDFLGTPGPAILAKAMPARVVEDYPRGRLRANRA